MKPTRQPFVPFVSTSPPATTPGFQDLRLTVIPQADQAQPFRPVSGEQPEGASIPELNPTPPTSCLSEPRITLQQDGGRVTRISIQCVCGHTIDLACIY